MESYPLVQPAAATAIWMPCSAGRGPDELSTVEALDVLGQIAGWRGGDVVLPAASRHARICRNWSDARRNRA